jgi:hypothetical protein
MPSIVSKNRTCQILQTGHVKISPLISNHDMLITFVRVRPVFVRVRPVFVRVRPVFVRVRPVFVRVRVIFSFKINVLRTS